MDSIGSRMSVFPESAAPASDVGTREDPAGATSVPAPSGTADEVALSDSAQEALAEDSSEQTADRGDKSGSRKREFVVPADNLPHPPRTGYPMIDKFVDTMCDFIGWAAYLL